VSLRLTLLRRRRRDLLRRQQRERVEIAVRVRRQTDAQMDIRLGAFGLSARPDGPHDLAFADGRPHPDRDRAQVDERGRVPVLGPDRQAPTFVWQLPGESDDSGRRRHHIRARRRADVDSTVLAAGVGVVPSDERPKHRAVDRPAPPRRTGGPDGRRERNGSRCHSCSVA
jgi:hypothetical protein